MKYIILISIISVAYGTPGGAPDCVDRPLGHNGGNNPQTGPSGVTISADESGDGSVFITVTADTPFKGILITSTAAGQFLVPDGQPLQLMLCTGITHVSSDLKSEVSAIFVKADPASKAEFNLIVVRDFETYWTEIKFSS
ncbi:uncharacterized protein LOC111707884 [Eurytemora carolleeae]|uniref:uncharacterized protein LOC111707884 n=1 Tax=Eurytemora carolleeae TaxID=1294199 RepID=UPI000C77681F|nr:uncharacterized protein LOC111707884 [Eurytemora carolleeae]|eukprot:XP_023336835.1 uncharacterized protein LOC111707884 [Eurytemora affinis]